MMNENIDLIKILKDCPNEWNLWSPLFGEVKFLRIFGDYIEIIDKIGTQAYFDKLGRYITTYETVNSCMLFPSKDQMEWSKFTAPWYKTETCTIDSIEKQGEQTTLQINERAWLYLVSDVLTWKDGIGQYLDDPRVQELAKKLCSEYSQKLYNHSNTENDEQKSADKIEPKFEVGDWITSNLSNSSNLLCIIDVDETNYEVVTTQGSTGVPSIRYIDKHYRLWTIQDAKDGDILANDHHILILKELVYDWSSNGTPYSVKAYCGIKPNGNFEIGKDNWSFCGTLHINPATKKQRDTLMKAMNDAGYEWDMKKKELNKFVPNRFDPKTLKPFDKILVRRSNENHDVWFPDFVSDPPDDTSNKTLCMCIMEDILMVIPYNDDTRHLVGTSEEAPEFYRHWED